jgi:type II secretory pathway component GspD/PulD (secretin)
MAPLRKRTLVILFGILLILLTIMAGPSLAEVAVIKVNYRSASDILPLVQTLLSPRGKVTLDIRTNTIIVNDTSESVAKIQALVVNMDKPSEQVRIRFRFQETGLSKDRDLSASGKVSGDRWSAATGRSRREGVHVRARDTRVNRQGTTESFISVMSGSFAYIWVGKDIPFTEQWVYLSRRYAHVVEKVNFQRVETGFEVRPVITGNSVHIEIVPRISSLEEGERGVVRLAEASTTMTVLKGQWVTIAGTSEQSNEVIRDILSTGSSSTNSTLSLSLEVE